MPTDFPTYPTAQHVHAPKPGEKCPTCNRERTVSLNSPGTMAKPGQVRVRPLGWKRTRGRPRKTARDKRYVEFL